MTEPGDYWLQMNMQPRYAARALHQHRVPDAPGVYAWYHGAEAVYAGVAAGAEGLRKRLGNHLALGQDLSRSSFRRNVCEYLEIAPTAVTRRRPAELLAQQVAPVNDWIRECAVAWIVCESAAAARLLEKKLLAEWKPPLCRR